MGTTFVNIGECGFWMSDSLLEIWLRLLALHIEEPTEDYSIAYDIRNSWLLASKGYFVGAIPINLGEHISTEKRKLIVTKAINSLINSLSSFEFFDKNTLNTLGINGIWTRDIESRLLIEIGNAFIELIEGRIKKKANNSDFIPGWKGQ